MDERGTVFVKLRCETGWIYKRSPEQEHDRAFRLDPQPTMWIFDPDHQIHYHSEGGSVALVQDIEETADSRRPQSGTSMKTETVFASIGEKFRRPTPQVRPSCIWPMAAATFPRRTAPRGRCEG